MLDRRCPDDLADIGDYKYLNINFGFEVRLPRAAPPAAVAAVLAGNCKYGDTFNSVLAGAVHD